MHQLPAESVTLVCHVQPPRLPPLYVVFLFVGCLLTGPTFFAIGLALSPTWHGPF